MVSHFVCTNLVCLLWMVLWMVWWMVPLAYAPYSWHITPGCAYTHTRTRTCTRTHMHMHTTHTHTHTRTLAHFHTHAHAHARAHAHVLPGRHHGSWGRARAVWGMLRIRWVHYMRHSSAVFSIPRDMWPLKMDWYVRLVINWIHWIRLDESWHDESSMDPSSRTEYVPTRNRLVDEIRHPSDSICNE